MAIYATPQALESIKRALADAGPEDRAETLRTIGRLVDGSERGRASLNAGPEDLRDLVVSGAGGTDLAWRQLPGPERELVAAAPAGDVDGLRQQAAAVLGRGTRAAQLDAYGNGVAPAGTVAQRAAAVDGRRAMDAALGGQTSLASGPQSGLSQADAGQRQTRARQDRGSTFDR